MTQENRIPVDVDAVDAIPRTLSPFFDQDVGGTTGLSLSRIRAFPLLTGEVFPDPILVVCAHLDSAHDSQPGADDNGSITIGEATSAIKGVIAVCDGKLPDRPDRQPISPALLNDLALSFVQFMAHDLPHRPVQADENPSNS